MFDILGITLSFFAIIALGAFTKYIGLFDEKSSQIFSNFAFYIALPPLLIISIMANPLKGHINFDYIVRFETATLIIFLSTYIVAKFIFKLNGSENSVFALNSTFSNYGYIGIPLVILLFGQEAVLPASLILVFDISFVLALVAIFSTNFNSSSAFLNLIKVLKSILKNPVIISCVVGLLLSYSDFNLGKIPEETLNILSGAAVPTALFAIGIIIVSKKVEKAYSELIFISVVKLIIHPLLVILLFLFWSSDTLKMLDIMWMQVAIIFSCLPVAANVFPVSQYYKSYVSKTSSAIIVTTIISIITIPTILLLVTNENISNFL
ncbi:AEC family transporter [Alphaproteobacteria bacterium]|nr:AEC family transporter [Alphaproteobacteria bacterium]